MKKILLAGASILASIAVGLCMLAFSLTDSPKTNPGDAVVATDGPDHTQRTKVTDSSPSLTKQTKSKANAQSNSSGYAPDRLIFTAAKNLDPAKVIERLKEQGVRASSVEPIYDAANKGTTYKLTYDGKIDPTDLAQKMTELKLATSAEPDGILTCMKEAENEPESTNKGENDLVIQAVPDATQDKSTEPLFEDQDTVQTKALPNDPYLSWNWWPESIGAEQAWNRASPSGKVTVAVIDSGVDTDHPDLANNLLLNYALNTYTGGVGRNAVEDDNGHGTHVAGIVAAEANNGIGSTGVSNGAKILPIKANISGTENFYTSDLIAALNYVVGLKKDGATPELANIRVVNMSVGGTNWSYAYQNAVTATHDAGILVVAAAGNESSSSVCYPAAYQNAVGVSALRSASDGAGAFDYSYSNYGYGVDLAAPGTSILSCGLHGSYKTMSGTSMACPMVAGAAALIFACSPDSSPADVETILEETAHDLGSPGRDDYYGYGALNLAAAVDKACPKEPASDPSYYWNYDDGAYTLTKSFALYCSAQGSIFCEYSSSNPEVGYFAGQSLLSYSESSHGSLSYVSAKTRSTFYITGTGYTRLTCTFRGMTVFDFWVKVDPAVAAEPIVQDLTYNGYLQEAFSDLPSDGYSCSKRWATEAGLYYAVVELDPHYVWPDGTTDPKTIYFTIAKAPLTATFESQQFCNPSNVDYSVKVEGFVAGETPETAAGYQAPYVDFDASSMQKGDCWNVTPAGGAANNYEFAYATGTLTYVEHATEPDPRVSPTCTESGLTPGAHCGNCGEILHEQQTVDPLGHSPARLEAVAPTCTATGLTEGSACERCQEVLVAQQPVEPLGHGFAAYASDGNATCTADGTQTARCSRCSTTDTRTVEDSALGHDWQEQLAGDAGGHWQPCSRCAAKHGQAPHSFGGWAEVAEPTAGAPGSDRRECADCGHVEERVVVLAGSSASVLGSGLTYTGRAQRPKVRLVVERDNGTLRDVPAADMQLSYSGNVSAGTAYVTVTCPKYLEQPLRLSFAIRKAGQSYAKVATSTVTAKGLKRGKLKSTRSAALKASGVKGGAKVRWSKASGAGGSKIKVSTSGRIYAYKGLKKGTYKVKVRMSVAGSRNYNARNVYKYVKVVVR